MVTLHEKGESRNKKERWPHEEVKGSYTLEAHLTKLYSSVPVKKLDLVTQCWEKLPSHLNSGELQSFGGDHVGLDGQAHIRQVPKLAIVALMKYVVCAFNCIILTIGHTNQMKFKISGEPNVSHLDTWQFMDRGRPCIIPKQWDDVLLSAVHELPISLI